MGTELEDARYISLLSYKKDGGAVQTPVWTAGLDGKLVIFTAGDSYKVKRVGRNPKVRVAKCDARGKVLGEWSDGTCAIVEDAARIEAIMKALGKKYGVQMKVLNFFAAVAGRTSKRAYLEVTLA